MAAASAVAAGFFRLETKVIGRSQGFSAVAASAYRSRSALADERTGITHDYTRHSNRPDFEGFYPAAHAQEWAQTRESYWNAVETRENRKDSQLAKDFTISFPHEMELEHARFALQDFIRENFTRKGLAADLAIHPAHEHGDQRNVHAHLMVALRRIDGQGQWEKNKEQFVKDPETGRYGPDAAQMLHLRERAAHHFNRQLERFGYDLQVDHRCNEERGLDQEPTVHLGKAAAALEREGVRTGPGDANREIEARNRQRRLEPLELVQQYDAAEAAHERAARIERQRLETGDARREPLQPVPSLPDPPVRREDRTVLEVSQQRLASEEFNAYQTDRRAVQPVSPHSHMPEMSGSLVRAATLQPLQRPAAKLIGRFAGMAAAAIGLAGDLLDSLFTPAEPSRLKLPPPERQAKSEVAIEPPKQEPAPSPPRRSLVDDLLAEAQASGRRALQNTLEDYESRMETDRRRRPFRHE